MRKKGHTIIAKALFRKLGLPKEYEKIFVKAIVEPDNWRRRNPHLKHHSLRHGIVLDQLKKARRAYINDDIPTCLWSLGIALHFIQDAFIPSPRTQRLKKIHEHLEGYMESYKSETLSMVNDAVDEGFKASISSPPKSIERTLANIRWIYDVRDLKMIVKTSAMITAAVFGSKDPPSGLREKYMMLKMSHDRRVSTASIISLISIFVGSVLLFTIPDPLIFFTFFMLVPSLAYRYVVSDKEFYEIKEEAEWYGIE